MIEAMPASQVTEWLAYLKIEKQELEAAHLKSVASGGVQKARAQGFRGRR